MIRGEARLEFVQKTRHPDRKRRGCQTIFRLKQYLKEGNQPGAEIEMLIKHQRPAQSEINTNKTISLRTGE